MVTTQHNSSCKCGLNREINDETDLSSTINQMLIRGTCDYGPLTIGSLERYCVSNVITSNTYEIIYLTVCECQLNREEADV